MTATHAPNVAFFWLALRTLTFWVFVETTIRSLKVKLLGGVQKSAKLNREYLGLKVLHADLGAQIEHNNVHGPLKFSWGPSSPKREGLR